MYSLQMFQVTASSLIDPVAVAAARPLLRSLLSMTASRLIEFAVGAPALMMDSMNRILEKQHHVRLRECHYERYHYYDDYLVNIAGMEVDALF